MKFCLKNETVDCHVGPVQGMFLSTKESSYSVHLFIPFAGLPLH